MKNILVIMSVILLSSCSSKVKVSQDILYIFPVEVSKKISDYLKKNDKKNTYLSIRNNNLGNTIVYISYDYNLNHKYYIDNTNRKVYINSKFYPVIFETDEIFSHPESSDSILYKMKNELPVKSIYSIYDNVFSITFDRSGKIIQ